jgi:nicotinate-nucleotide--dimethylbenzimidazole phosphoribosyltransferase
MIKTMPEFLRDLHIPPLDEKMRRQVKAHWANLAKPRGSLGRLEDLAATLAAMTGRLPEFLPKAMILASGDHGVAEHGVSNFPQEVTIQMIKSYLRYSAGANVLARHAGLRDEDVFVLDVGVKADLAPHPQLIVQKAGYGTADFTKGPAMSREQAILSLQAGFSLANRCLDRGYKLLILSEMGIGNTTASAAMAVAFTGLTPEDTVGRGTGIGDKRLAVKREVVARGLALNRPDKDDPLDVLAKVGGYELGSLAGVALAGAARRAPVFVDGMNATAAVLVAYGLFPKVRDYLLPSHLSAERGHAAMLDILGLRPLLTARMRLGEGTGASVVIALLDAAIRVFREAA